LRSLRLLGIPLLVCVVSQFAPAAATAGEAKAVAEFGRLPLRFERNIGQAPDKVRFVARGLQNDLALTTDGFTVAFRAGDQLRTVTIRFQGADNVDPIGLERQEATSNYLVGSNPHNWRTNVPNFSRVRYPGVYAGVSTEFYGNQQQLEYDFSVAPGADATRVRFSIKHISKLSVDADGNLLLGTTGVKLLRPIAYQETELGRISVAARYKVSRDIVSFELGKYDRRRALVIDPVLSYSSYVSAAGESSPFVAVDAAGSAYLLGVTWATNFPIAQALQPTCNNCTNAPDIFVMKLNPQGTGIVYSTYLGGSSYETPTGIAVDASGNAFVTGSTTSKDFPVKNSLSAPAGGTLGFLAALNSTGSGLVFSTYVGGSGGASTDAVALDAGGNAYITGVAHSADIQQTNPEFQPVASSYSFSSLYVQKYTPAGQLAFSTVFGHGSDTSGWANQFYAASIAVDGSGNSYITGSASLGLPTTTGSLQPVFPGTNTNQNTAAFVSKLNAAGSALLYSTYLGSAANGSDTASAIAVDAAGNAYIGGGSASNAFPVTSGAYLAPAPGSQICCNGFVAKLNPAGSALVYATLVGTNVSNHGQTQVRSLAIDAAGDAYVTGYTNDKNFPLSHPIQATRPLAGSSAFVSEFDPAGATLLFSTYLSGSTGTNGFGIRLDSAGAAYVSGETNDLDFPTTPGAWVTSVPPPAPYALSNHGFIAKLTLANSPAPVACYSSQQLLFGPTPVGTTSTRNLTVTNCGDAPLTIKSVTPSAASFGQTNNCTSALAPGTSCTVTASFSPTMPGNTPGSYTFATNAQISTQKIPALGDGTSPQLRMNQSAGIQFDSQIIGNTSQVVNIYVANTGDAPLTISSVSISGDFAQTNNCVGTFTVNTANPPGCVINATFTPTAAGTRTGTITIVDNAPGSPHTATLVGTGFSEYPTPVMTSITPEAIAIGSSDTTVTIDGSNFFSTSLVNWNGAARPATFVNSRQLKVTASAADLTRMGEAQLTVLNPAPGGSSPAMIETLYATLPVAARDLAYDPYGRVLYASVGKDAVQYAGSVVPINPSTLAVGAPIAVGGDPRKLAISDDGQFLYLAQADGSAQRITLATQSVSLTFNAATTSTGGTITDLTVMPGHPHTVAITGTISGLPSGVTLFDDGVARPAVPTYTQAMSMSSVRFLADPTLLYSMDAMSPRFSVMGATQSGLVFVRQSGFIPAPGPTTLLEGSLETDGNILVSTAGQVIDPVAMTPSLLLKQSDGWLASGAPRPESSAGRIFVLTSGARLFSFDSNSGAQLGSIAFNAGWNRLPRLARWGSDGIAFPAAKSGTGDVDTTVVARTRLARGSTLSVAQPAVTAISPASAAVGGANLLLTVNGSNFVPGSVVRWNGSERSTSFVNSGRLQAAIPASDLRSAGSAQVTVVTPAGAVSPAVSMPISTGVVIAAPLSGGTVKSPVRVVADAAGAQPISSAIVYVDNAQVFATSSAHVDTFVPMNSGNHTIVVQAWDAAGAIYKASETVSAVSDQLPIAQLSLSPASGIAPVTVTASTAGSSDDGVVLSSTINWGDGTSSIGPDAQHVYNTPGTYTVTGIVMDNNGFTSARTATVSVAERPITSGCDRPCVWVTSPGPRAVTSPVHIVALAAQGSSPYPIQSMQVYVDYVLQYSAAGNSVDTYLPMGPGFHNVDVKEWDSAGGSVVSNEWFAVTTGATTPPPAAQLSVTPSSGASPLTVTATFTSSGGSTIVFPDNALYLYTWNWGDGTFMPGDGNGIEGPTHTYTAPGTYQLVGSATDHTGATGTATATVTVSGLSPATPSCTAPCVQFLSPTNPSAASSPVDVRATGTPGQYQSLSSMKLYLDSVLTYSTSGATLDTSLNMTPGTHDIRVDAIDYASQLVDATSSMLVTVPGGSSLSTVTNTPVIPQTGWWWDGPHGTNNAGLDGTGLFIEYRPATGQSPAGMFVGGFFYDSSGASKWLVSFATVGGTLSNNGTGLTYSGKWLHCTGGQGLTEAWKQNACADEPNGGVTITFSDATHATMTRPDGTLVPLTRFGFTASPTILAPQAGSAESGFWWVDPANTTYNSQGKGGTGYGIEFQGNVAFIVAYVYDHATGNPIWYLTQSGATPMPSPTSYNGTWNVYRGGPQWTSPELNTWGASIDGSYAGVAVTLNFTDATHGTMTMGNVVIPIVRFQAF
jgi:PKD repeat protein